MILVGRALHWLTRAHRVKTCLSAHKFVLSPRSALHAADLFPVVLDFIRFCIVLLLLRYGNSVHTIVFPRLIHDPYSTPHVTRFHPPGPSLRLIDCKVPLLTSLLFTFTFTVVPGLQLLVTATLDRKTSFPSSTSIVLRIVDDPTFHHRVLTLKPAATLYKTL